MNILEFAEDATNDQKLSLLFEHHQFTQPVEISEEDKDMIIVALNHTDVASVSCDAEGALIIEYRGQE